VVGRSRLHRWRARLAGVAAPCAAIALLVSGCSETVTGFQVFRPPCEVTGIRAMLHLRNNGLLTPPTATETLAEGSQPITLRLDR